MQTHFMIDRKYLSFAPAKGGIMHLHHTWYQASYQLNPSLDGKILGLTKLKAFSDNKFNVAYMTISVSDREENIVGKAENAGYQHFLLFPQCFQKLFCGAMKTRNCLGMGSIKLNSVSQQTES